MKTIDAVATIVARFEKKGYTQVPGYNRFEFVKRTEKSVVVSRENGEDTPIPLAKLSKAVEAVRKDAGVYSEGPSSLRRHGFTHITSPLWALLHLLSLKELKE